MSEQVLLLLSKSVFGGSVLLVLYLIYREFKLNKISAEENEIKLGEEQNADLVSTLTDQQLVDKVNGTIEPSQLPIPPSKPSSKG